MTERLGIAHVQVSQVVKKRVASLVNKPRIDFWPKKKKESLADAGDAVSVPGLGRSPGEGNGNPLQYSRLSNSMDRGA